MRVPRGDLPRRIGRPDSFSSGVELSVKPRPVGTGIHKSVFSVGANLQKPHHQQLERP